MSEIDPYEGSPTLIAIPPSIYKEFVKACKEANDLTSEDYDDLASLICLDAIVSYTESKKKRNARKRES